MELKRVVVTGLGAITPIGNTTKETWDNALSGVSGAAPITHFDASLFKTQFACEVKGYNSAEHFDRKELRKYDLYAQYGVVAAKEAIADSGLETLETLDRNRVGVIIAAGIGGLHTFEEEAGYYALNKEKGLGMIPTGKSLLEAFEMLEHFKAYEYVLNNTGHALDEAFLKEINRLVTLHTLAYRSPDATPGEYTTTDMAVGDTVFGDHEQLVAKVPQLLASTERAIASSEVHPVVLAARFHGFYEYLHPFRDGNGRTGRLVSNHILLRMGHPLIIIPSSCRQEYITSLRTIRTEGTDEHLIRFFFKMAMTRMADEIGQKEKNTQRFRTFMF